MLAVRIPGALNLHQILDQLVDVEGGVQRQIDLRAGRERQDAVHEVALDDLRQGQADLLLDRRIVAAMDGEEHAQAALGQAVQLRVELVEPEVLRFGDDVSNEHWSKWVQHRKEIRKPLTPSSTKSQVEFLNGFAPHTRAEIINQSIQNGWQGLFELKTKKNNDVNSEIQRIYSGLE